MISFIHVVDCVGASRGKKLFIQEGLPLLYWWDVYTAMQCPGKENKTFVCPCRVVNTTLVLVFILKTRCNKPHYDCLVYDMDTKKAFVLRMQTKWESKYELDPTLHDYDVDAMNM